MNTTFEFPAKFITNNHEKRINGDLFSLTLTGYYLFPIDSEIPVFKSEYTTSFGTCRIKSIHWKENQTTITYELISLHSTN